MDPHQSRIHARSEQRDRVGGTSCAAGDLEWQRHEQELVAPFLRAGARERLEQRVVEQRHAVTEQHAMHRPWSSCASAWRRACPSRTRPRRDRGRIARTRRAARGARRWLPRTLRRSARTPRVRSRRAARLRSQRSRPAPGRLASSSLPRRAVRCDMGARLMTRHIEQHAARDQSVAEGRDIPEARASRVELLAGSRPFHMPLPSHM